MAQAAHGVPQMLLLSGSRAMVAQAAHGVPQMLLLSGSHLEVACDMLMHTSWQVQW